MAGRTIVVWLGLLILAIANGGLRESLLKPWLGAPTGQTVSLLVLCVAILGMTWLTIHWLHPSNSRQALGIGGAWALLTAGFEFLAGHYLFRRPWGVLLADYNLLRGEIWILVPVTLLLAPLLIAQARGAFHPPSEN
jgi:hypothetical protein